MGPALHGLGEDDRTSGAEIGCTERGVVDTDVGAAKRESVDAD